MAKPCTVEDCDKNSRALKFCNAHYKMFKLYGDPLGGKPSLAERFWAKVQKGDGCWEWAAGTYSNGYGQFRADTTTMALAHRISYQLSVGPIPEGLHIDHICFNKACVNPAHLRPVTNKQNMENRSGPSKRNTSGVLGVRWVTTAGGRWVGQVGHNGTTLFVGYFNDLEEAEAAVMAKRLELFTHNNLDRIAA